VKHIADVLANSASLRRVVSARRLHQWLSEAVMPTAESQAALERHFTETNLSTTDAPANLSKLLKTIGADSLQRLDRYEVVEVYNHPQLGWTVELRLTRPSAAKPS
jgi:hypothetical protein